MTHKRLCTLPLLLIMMMAAMMTACKKDKPTATADGTHTDSVKGVPQFDADSAYLFCQQQCDFGPRTMNSQAHDDCGKWIAEKFAQLGCEVSTQQASLTGYDGTTLKATNIIAVAHPEKPVHILICAHWDSRPWADNDPDSTKWHTPVMAANDGASGVAVMLELARIIHNDSTLNVGIDFVCFDAEDWGTPRWSKQPEDEKSWALGAQYWAQQYQPSKGYVLQYGILLDMVGGQGAAFYQELSSLKYAPHVVEKVWNAARTAGYKDYFPAQNGGWITDDHGPINEIAGIPTIDIIPFYPNSQESSFGPTWHTVNDDMAHIDKNTLRAVGQTVLQVLYEE